ncbi:MAG TPA: DUF1648 domain-containing protein [Terriglobales bacterium]|jgi:Protein of unknown function (DUF1648)|nr:DUF1648 domain-containing protein [Terriglobales bacterium]
MNRRYFKFGIALMWLVLPLTALRYRTVWDELPPRMATHFNAAGQANGWMTREASFAFALGLTTFLLVLFSILLYLAQRRSVQDGQSALALMGFFYLILAVIYRVNSSIVEHALYGTAVNVGWVLIAVPLGILGLMTVFLRSHRGSAFPSSDAEILAEETHAGRAWAPLFVLPALPVVAAAMFVPNVPIKIAMLASASVLALTFFMAWEGFRYRFSRYGVDISTLGFRLQSIPREQIQGYAIAPWNMIGGYGIRGLGDSRAYVWGKQGVRITTTKGEVFLGHSEPERIVHDLDVLKQFAHS